MSVGSDLIAAERQRQIEVEGWSAEHDESHDEDLAYVAAWLAAPDSTKEFVDTGRDVEAGPSYWRVRLQQPDWRVARKTMPRVEALTKAGALIAAEIDRLAALSPVVSPEQQEGHAGSCG